MAPTIFHIIDVTIPAGTAKATPFIQLTQFAAQRLDGVEWRFPPGCQGFVGIQIGSHGTPILPFNPNQWFVRSGDAMQYDLTGMPDSGDWSVIGYNTGSFAHTIEITYRCSAITKPPNFNLALDGAVSILALGES
jgi:hypothetical protein